MISMVSALLAALLMLHPGHSTRVEVQWNRESEKIELAMRIDHADLESALQKRLGHSILMEDLSEQQAEQWIGSYLRETLRVDNGKLPAERFSWIGWQRKRISSWIYAELSIPDPQADSVSLKILSLLEVEPELNHVVTIRHSGRQESVVLSKQKPLVVIATGANGANR